MAESKARAGPIPRRYLCYRAPHPPALDGTLADPTWDAAPWTEDFVDIEGAAEFLPRFRTRVKMLWDDRCLYVGAELEEPHVWATLTEHDSVIFHDNDFEIFLDPDGDNHSYFEFEINALNTGCDLRLVKPYRDGGPALNEWEIPGLRTAVHVDGTLNDPGDRDTGWSVDGRESPAEPSRARQQANAPGQPRARQQAGPEHGVPRYRKLPGLREDNWVWSPQGVIDMHRPERWGYVQFTSAPPGKGHFRPDPTAAARDRLHLVYYAQRAYHERGGRYAASLPELRRAVPEASVPVRGITLEATSSGYTATASVRLAEGRTRRVRIRQDSRVELD